MEILLLILGMLFFHIIDDYYLQGWLASAKQKSWWEKNAPEKMYKNDYKCALIEHAFSWTCMIHIPVVIFLYQCVDMQKYTGTWKILLVTFILNWINHALVDDMKANKKLINLCADQAIHVIQIIITAVIFFIPLLIER